MPDPGMPPHEASDSSARGAPTERAPADDAILGDTVDATAETRQAEAPPSDPDIQPTRQLLRARPDLGALGAGALFGPYRVLERLGQGGMGTVYKAVHLKLGKIMAVKVLPPHVNRNDAAIARFEREMRAVGRLAHPRIVQAHDAGDVDGAHYLAMEYIEGHDLAKLIQAQGPLAVPFACGIIQQSAEALAAAHAAGIVHRDVKPSNLLLDANGRVKLLDLGLARSLEADSEEIGLTAAGQTFGTPDYMAPEQWGDARAVDGRTDLDALGCTLFYLLAGRSPFSAAGAGGLSASMRAHVCDAPPDLRALRNDIPDGLAAIVARLLAKAPDDRFPTAQALETALAPFAGATDLASPSATPESFKVPSVSSVAPSRRRPSRRGLPRAGLGAVAALALALAVVLFLATRDRGAPVRSESPPVPSPPPTAPPAAASPARPAAVLRFALGGKVMVPTLRSLPDPAGPFTIEATVTPDTFAAANHVNLVDFDDQAAMRISSVDRYYSFVSYKGSSRMKLDSAVAAVPGQRVRVAAVRSGAGIRIFVDGRLVGFAPETLAPLGPSSKCLVIGEDFHGLLTEIRISSVARYETDYTPRERFEPDAQTVALYHGDENTGTTLTDASGHNHHGSILGARWVDAASAPSPTPASSP